MGFWPAFSKMAAIAQNGSPSGGRSRPSHDDALGEQIFVVTKTEYEPEIEPDRLVNNLRWEPIAAIADFGHALWLSRIPKTSKLCASWHSSYARASLRLVEFERHPIDLADGIVFTVIEIGVWRFAGGRRCGGSAAGSRPRTDSPLCPSDWR